MVVDTRIELVTPAMSMQCSTAELIDRFKFSTAQIGLCGPSVKRLARRWVRRPSRARLHRRSRADETALTVSLIQPASAPPKTEQQRQNL